MTGTSGVNLGEAAGQFLATLPAEAMSGSQQEIYRFVRWYGWEQTFNGLNPAAVANYAEQLSQSDADYLKKLELTRAFLTYARKQGWSKVNLANHLKARKTKSQQASPRRQKRQPVSLTRQGYDELKAELAVLQEKRLGLIEDIRRAAYTQARQVFMDSMGKYGAALAKEIDKISKSIARTDITEQARAETLNVIIQNLSRIRNVLSGKG